MANCERCTHNLCAKKVPIFSNLSRDELIEIIKMTGHREYKKGETIFLEGTDANTLYIINEGRIKLFKYTKDGKEQILHILSNGDFFGELNLFKDGEYNFNAKAIMETKICTLTKDKMKAIILDKPEIGLKILEVIGDRLSNVETLAQSLATNDVEARIAKLLLDLKEEYGKEVLKGTSLKLPITKGDMSNYTGVARETISRKLKKFEEEGIIELVGTKKIVIIDEEKLEDYLF
ncbi:Crp/Fnr family transcriptional regulator [Sporosalibacterium faouarense]|uniref:Crp/Fnr family transcriptional regulator n=1 Tax=Sporosalibacterium faouarense TaxID=516123 RepID=UPI00141D2AD4|nr:Crp/Fnr family transcriptional regulator [Sporosalibacterium faouarense]MTI48715.1 Crp/Fnr family transcriptional regulator [Bacillota bacterium]